MFSNLFDPVDLTSHRIFVKSCPTVSSCFLAKSIFILENLFLALLNKPINQKTHPPVMQN